LGSILHEKVLLEECWSRRPASYLALDVLHHWQAGDINFCQWRMQDLRMGVSNDAGEIV
jgi:hypothetical protein